MQGYENPHVYIGFQSVNLFKHVTVKVPVGLTASF